MITNDLAAVRELTAAATDGPWEHGGNDGLVWGPRIGDPVSGSTEPEDADFIAAARTGWPACADEIEQLRAEIDQLRSENHTLERAVMDSILTARPVLPYRSTTADGLSGVTLAVGDGQVLVDGLAHTPTAALELSAAIARAAGATTTTGAFHG